ncbi:TPA: hypothetical protein DCP13_00080 [Candidatus Azambacteria bacterium]|uniref:Uncharacterized protein n=4 Tax=Candidatus Azamiibacteriota TaxID=1752741 RepID=A0A0G1SCX8_9BACT|nr:MAG: hypothetical protein UX51_C0050G0008 [Candidatus Azambacteria bacterium GW2011_GWF2_46_32]KKU39963.1 MAG: hypothetical protein UX55_C0020G0006 [Candidatus Azambacteria bacterium GW2011_GWE2_46_45]HAM95679.1 hypothetical protein [Candidatus Azambacteria bacterium]HAQ05200.1 hypothetical protein [Candidatus Azambacteria bacterium]HBA52458.1 hypothetical protein [Candidatus Azambacteria bacterium]
MKQGERMKNFKDAVKVIGFILIISIFAFAGKAIAADANEPGPSFDGWTQSGTLEGWHAQAITVHFYTDQSQELLTMGMMGEYSPTGEIVMKGWDMTAEGGTVNIENARVSIKLEDGTWVVGQKGSVYHVEEVTRDDGSVWVWYYVSTEDGQEVGRSFPK